MASTEKMSKRDLDCFGVVAKISNSGQLHVNSRDSSGFGGTEEV